MAGFLLKAIQVRRRWRNIFKVLKTDNLEFYAQPKYDSKTKGK